VRPVDAPLVTFLSDYGSSDEFVGVCHGVIARLCPEARIIDITHGVPRHDTRAGAIALRNALRFFAPGVHVAVVDPTVGAQGHGARRAVALRVADEGRLLVGPDNGLLSLAAERFGGVIEAVDVGRSPHRLESVSATFHGRDIFAPVAAALARGEPLADAGEPLAVEELRALALPQARVAEGTVVAHALTVDRFGNVILDATHEQLASAGLRLGAAVALTVGASSHGGRYSTAFADVEPGRLLLYEDAQQMAALAVNCGSAADALGVTPDDEVVLRPA
jgi:S-adenosylmethionine hydrolase